MRDHTSKDDSSPATGSTPATRRRRAATAARSRGTAVAKRPHDWATRQDVTTRPGAAIGWWRRYREIGGPLQSLLLTVYVFLAILPAVLVLAEYMDNNPASLADNMIHRYGLNTHVAVQLRAVLVGDKHHELGTALLAIAGALFFGLGFGRVVQLVYSRAWRIEVREKLSDQARYAAVLLVLFVLIALLEFQTKEIAGHSWWAGAALAPAWVVVLATYFVWAPWMLTHRQLTRRALVPGSLVTALGLVGLMYFSTVVMGFWVDFYATDYAGLGVVMALFFWLGFSSTVIVIGASLSPILAERRHLRAAA